MRSRSAGGIGSSTLAVVRNSTSDRSNGHVQVVIAERVVLLGIEHFEQRRRRVAAEVGAELVDLVEDEDRVLRLGAAQPLDDLPGQRADVGAAMAADLRLVAHAAERDPHELAAERVGDRLRQRGLADARRAEEAEDRPLDVRIQLPDRQVLDHAVLDLLEAGVIGVEDVLGPLQIDGVLGALRPRQRDEPVEVGARHRCIPRRRPASSTADRARAALPS